MSISCYFLFFFISVPNFIVVTTGVGESGWLTNTETIDIGNNSEPPYYPDHPRRLYAATGGFLHQDFITCGGAVTNQCFNFDGPFTTMMMERKGAASVVLDNEKLWILGGENVSSIHSSTEYIFSDGRVEEGPSMPIPLTDHAMVKINKTTSFLVGGVDGMNTYFNYKSWFYDGNWIEGPDVQSYRDQASVGIVRDSVTDQVYIVLAGGFKKSDVNILSVTGSAWETGNLL